MLPDSLVRRLVNHAPPRDVTEGYAADWSLAQLRRASKRIANRIEGLARGSPKRSGANAAGERR